MRRPSLDAGRKPDPEAPTWRDDRDGRSGAPLWRLVELAPGVEASGDRRGGGRPRTPPGCSMPGCRPTGWSTSPPTTWNWCPGRRRRRPGADPGRPAGAPGRRRGGFRSGGRRAGLDPGGPARRSDRRRRWRRGADGNGRLLPAGQRGGPGSGRPGHPPRRRGPGTPTPPTAVRGGRRPGPRWSGAGPDPASPGRARPRSTGRRGPSRRRSLVGAPSPGRPRR